MSEKQMGFCKKCGREVEFIWKEQQVVSEHMIGGKKHRIFLSSAVCTECGGDVNCMELFRRWLEETESYMESIDRKEYQEYANLVTTYFTPYDYLRRWWEPDEIIAACLLCGCSEDNLTEEIVVPMGEKCKDRPCEYLRTGDLQVPDYDMDPEKFLKNGPHMITKHGDIYRVRGSFEPTAKVMKLLLYSAYPELSDYDVKISPAAYLADTPTMNQLFGPRTRSLRLLDKRIGFPLCAPYSAIMNGDVEAIKKQSRFCAGKNPLMKETLKCPEAERFFEIIAGGKNNTNP